MFITFLSNAIRLSATFLFGSTGEIVTEKSGHLNLGIPGVMCVGAVGGCIGEWLYLSSLSDVGKINGFLAVIIPVLTCLLFAAATGAIYSFLTVTLRANQNVTGLTLTTFGVGFTNFFIARVDKTNFNLASGYFTRCLPFADNLGWFGKLFFSYGVLVYLAIAVALLSAFVLKRTRIGLHLRAVGENPAAADAVGINVAVYRYSATCIGCAIAGLGGLFYIMDYLNGNWEYNIDAMGWLAVALVIFTMWKPDLSILGSIVFGALYIAGSYITGLTFAQKELVKMLPYLVTIVVLVLTSVFDSKNAQAPAGLGLNYFREER